jgi:hypothetical protein
MKEDIIKMAHEAGWKDLRESDSEMHEDFFMGKTQDLERFASLVAAAEREARSMRWDELIAKAVEAEREACAKVCDEMEQKAEGTECCKWPTPADCAHAIRARGQT